MREMKDSGYSWVGYIPQSWTLVPIKYLLTHEHDAIKVGPFGSQLAGNDFVDDGYWVYNQRAVIDCNFRDNTVFVSKDKYESLSAFKVRKDDILITTRGTIGRICRVPEEYMEGIIHPCIIKFRIDDTKVIYNFLQRIFNDSDFVKRQILYKSNATTIDVIYGDTLRNIVIPVPSIQEQRTILDYINPICNEIDALSADIQAQIDVLEQYKRSVITEAVTKGLNPDATMKDSGYEWVGLIPLSWSMRRGKYLFSQRNQRGNCIELQLLSPTQKYGVIPQAVYEELSGMSAVKLNEKADLALLKTIHKGDYCISLRSFQGGFEYSEFEGVVSPAYQVFYPIVEIHDGYYKYLFKERGFIEKMNSYTMTLRDGKNIAFSDFGNTYIPYPPVSEQCAIAQYLDVKCAEIDAIIETKAEQIRIADAYKKSVIFEYVTGKKQIEG